MNLFVMGRKKAKRRDPSLRNITRIDAGSTHAWEVRIMRRGEQYAKTFTDRQLGGKARALAAARKYRDQMLRKLTGYSREELLTKASSRNTSGYPGVRKLETNVRKGKWIYSYAFWEASWTPRPGGKRVKRRFSVQKYGDKKAKQLAIEARRKGLGLRKSR